MTLSTSTQTARTLNWRIVGWTLAVLILLTPLIAMQFTDEVNWQTMDFVVFGLMLAAVGLGMELTLRAKAQRLYQVAMIVTLIMAFLLVWLSLGIGIIGEAGNPANRWYLVGLCIGFFIALFYRFSALGMMKSLLSLMVFELLLLCIVVLNEQSIASNLTLKLVILNGAFIVMQFIAALLFYKVSKVH